MFCYCAQSRRLARLLTARYDAALSGSGLTAAQFETLSVMQALGESSGRALAERLDLDKTTLSRNLKALIDAKLIAAHRSEEDARQILHKLTAKGAQRLAKAMPLWQQAHDASLGLLGSYAAPAERALQRMAVALH